MLLLLLALFVSGVAGLTYQVLWLRLLSLVFGVTAYAASTVLASFMAGLALGSFLAGRVALRARHPLIWFGCAELLIGLSALATPTALDAVGRLYGAAVFSVGDELALTTALRFACALAVLIVPTTLMGATLPLVVASPLVRGQQGTDARTAGATAATGADAIASRIGALYGTNTAGAILGAFLTGFYLIGTIGIRATFLWAAVLNTLAGAVAIWLSRRYESERADATAAAVAPADVNADAGADGDADPRAHATPSLLAMRLVFGLSGCAALALEVIWFRILVLFLPATTYAFTTMLATVLAGLAGGGWIAARLLRRDRDWLTWLTVIQLATGIVVLGSVNLLAISYARGWSTTGSIQASVVAILPASLLMGISFPIGLRVASRRGGGREIAHRLGTLYSVNVLGAIIGSTLAGFLLLPRLGSRVSLVVCAALYLVSGVLLAMVVPKPRPSGRRVRALAMTVGAIALFVFAATRVPDPFRATLLRRHGPLERVLWHDEGVQTTVAVHGTAMGGHVLYLDGLHQANDTADMLRVHRQIGHLAVMLHPNPKDVLVIGLGGGVTAGAVSQHDVSLDIVELSDGVRQAARWFSHVNYDVLNQPRVHLRVDDGRNFLTRRPGQYDVITADIIQPIHAGAGHLYSVEYFRLAAQALKDDGLMLQWVGQRERTQYQLIVRTFMTAFPYTTLWADGTLLVGTKHPLVLHRDGFDRQMANPRTRAALEWVGLNSFDTLLSWYTAGPRTIQRVIGVGPILSDDRPMIEFHRSLPTDAGLVDITPLREPNAHPTVELN